LKYLVNSRKALVITAIVVTFLAIVVPTCRMVGCSMDMSGGMGFMHPGPGVGFFSTCGGEMLTSEAPLSVAPGGLETLLLALIALVVGLVLFAPRDSAAYSLIEVVEPPPPPRDPLGERFRV